MSAWKASPAPPPATIATLSVRPQLSGTSKRCASAMSPSRSCGFYHRRSRAGSAEPHAEDADRVRRELVLEPLAPRRGAGLAHVDGPRGLERVGRVDVRAVDLGDEHVVLLGGRG